MSAAVPLSGADALLTAVFLSLTATGLRHRSQPGARSGAALWFCLAVLAGILACGRAAVLAAEPTVYALGAGWVLLVPAWAGFVFEYTGRGPRLTPRWVGAAAVYVGLTVAVTGWSNGAGTTAGLFRVGAALLQTALVGVGLFGVFLVVRSARADDEFPTGQAVLVSLGGLGVSLFVFPLSMARGDPATLPPTITGALAWIAVGFGAGAARYRLFGDAPGIGHFARRSVLEEMSEPLVVVDRDGRLVDANAAAEDGLGVTLARDAGRPVETALGYDPADIVGEPTTVPTPRGQRRLAVRRSELTDARGETVGASYLFRDVTDERTRKQRLEVFNRVLRHNLRNDLDAIRGFAEALAEGATDDTADVAERIRGTASDLSDIGATVERAERVMTRDSLDLQRVDLAALADEVRTDVAERYDCQIALQTGADPRRLHTDREMLRTALVEVVENAVEHSDRPVPSASIVLSRGEDGARIAVRDDGPGIPDRERAILLEGEETPLEHGTGVGLWLVSWAVARLGGELTIDDREDAGSEVVLVVPDRLASD